MKIFLRPLVLILSLTFLSTNLAASEGAFFIDILYLQEGKTSKDAADYFNKIEPVVRKHGLRRIIPGLQTATNMKGDLKADLVNVWMVTDSKTTFKNIFEDPDYLQYVAIRNATFDMKKANMFTAQPF
ncbi:MAG: hypothetical protein KUG78_15250 [Kangiellaceae bacterium]|nr:hypothetical protein [Kangiellaceae bacterium]